MKHIKAVLFRLYRFSKVFVKVLCEILVPHHWDTCSIHFGNHGTAAHFRNDALLFGLKLGEMSSWFCGLHTHSSCRKRAIWTSARVNTREFVSKNRKYAWVKQWDDRDWISFFVNIGKTRRRGVGAEGRQVLNWKGKCYLWKGSFTVSGGEEVRAEASCNQAPLACQTLDSSFWFGRDGTRTIVLGL